MLKEGLFGLVELLVARSISVVVMSMFRMYSAVAGTAEMAMVGFGRGKILTEWWSSIFGSHIVKAP